MALESSARTKTPTSFAGKARPAMVMRKRRRPRSPSCLCATGLSIAGLVLAAVVAHLSARVATWEDVRRRGAGKEPVFTALGR
ncbi:MAG: hypothetical protein BGO98_00105 [Myxococcales bacterium 68-20]|nr:MAG: hypothetical protein BGO98_00105 [Myxococcales bacterium 68-20]